MRVRKREKHGQTPPKTNTTANLMVLWRGQVKAAEQRRTLDAQMRGSFTVSVKCCHSLCSLTTCFCGLRRMQILLCSMLPAPSNPHQCTCISTAIADRTRIPSGTLALSLSLSLYYRQACLLMDGLHMRDHHVFATFAR